MPVGWKAVRSLLLAAAFSQAQLEALCQTVFGASLTGISNSADPQEQADAIVEFAQQYGLIRELTDMILHNAANRPAVQNLLLSDDMDASATSTMQGEFHRMNVRVDQLGNQVGQLMARQDEQQRVTNDLSNRLHTMEVDHQAERQATRRLEPVGTWGQALVWMMVLAVFVMLALSVYSTLVQR